MDSRGIVVSLLAPVQIFLRLRAVRKLIRTTERQLDG